MAIYLKYVLLKCFAVYFDKDILCRLFKFKFPATFEEMWRAQNILFVGDGNNSNPDPDFTFVHPLLMTPFVTINIMILIELLKFVNNIGDTTVSQRAPNEGS